MAEVKTTEEYDGTNYAGGGTATNTGGEFPSLAGVQGDALAVGGYTGSYHNNAESYDGTNWSGENDPTGSQHAGSAVGAGQSDYLQAGGSGSGVDKNGTLSFDGTNWSSLNDMNANRWVGCMNGTTSDVIYSGGSTLDSSELFDGTNWSSGPSPTSGRYSPSNSVACSGSANGVVFGGGTGSANSTGTNLIQEFDE